VKLYVDGNDLLEAIARRGSDVVVEGDRLKSRLNLARWLARYAEHQGCEVELVFDENPVGQALPPVQRHGRVRVVNLEPGGQALHAIAGPANREAEGGRVVVVSSDPRLMQALARGRARAVGAEDFLVSARRALRGGEGAGGLEEPDEKFSGLSDEEVERWLEFFDEGRGE